MLTVLVMIIHVFVSLALSDMFGGGMGAASAGSTVVERNLDRITVSVAIIFAFTTIILAIRLQA
jgi:preprotein translocase subunit SecG